MAPAADESHLCIFNGINGATGNYLIPPMEPERLIQSALGAAIDPKSSTDPEALTHAISGGSASLKHLDELKARHDLAKPFGVRPGVDSGKLEEAGWGIIFANDTDSAIKDALKELLELRKSQAADFYYEFEGYKGLRREDSHFVSWPGRGWGRVRPTPRRCPITC